jgi:hypothetical protein
MDMPGMSLMMLAEAYRGYMGMCMKCHTAKQAFNGLMTSGVIMERTTINMAGGNFGACYNMASTGFDNYMMVGAGYVMANNSMLDAGIRGVYKFESNMGQTCFNQGFPAASEYRSWDRCVANWATALQYDSLARMEWMKAPATMTEVPHNKRTDLTVMANDVNMVITNVLQSAHNCNTNSQMDVALTMTDQAQCVKDKMGDAVSMKMAMIAAGKGEWYNFFM